MKLCWIHCSDFHLNPNKNGWQADLVMTRLGQDMRQLCGREGLKPNMLFVTGDLAYGEGVAGMNLKAQFGTTLQAIKQWVRGLKIPKDQVFIVPGNHDVNRKKVKKTLQPFLDNLEKESFDDAKSEINGLMNQDEELSDYMQRLEDYHSEIKQRYPGLYPKAPAEDERDHNCLDLAMVYAHRFPIEGFEIGVFGMNSAWSCGGDGEKGKLWVGAEWQLNQAQTHLDGCDLRIGLSHHPDDWFAAPEAGVMKSRLKSSFDFFLHGHEHQVWVEQHQLENRGHINIAAGASFGDSLGEFGYNIVEYNLKTKSGRVFLRSFSNEGEGGWIAKHIPGLSNEQGIVTIGALEKENPDWPPAQESNDGIVGREADLKTLRALIDKNRVVVLYGMPGVGKSELIRKLTRQGLGEVRTQEVPKNADLDILNDRIDRTLQGAEGCLLHLDQAQRLLEGSNRQAGAKALVQLLINRPKLRLLVESRSSKAYESLRVACTKAILTEPAFLALKGINDNAVSEFFRKPFPKDSKIGWTILDTDRRTLYERLGGIRDDNDFGAHPQAMAFLATLAHEKGQHPVDVIRKMGDEYGEKLSEALYRAIYAEVLSKSQCRLLESLALYRVPVPRKHGIDLAESYGNAEDLGFLYSRCLITAGGDGGVFWIHQLVKDVSLNSGDFESHHGEIARLWLEDLKVSQRSNLETFKEAGEGAYHALHSGDPGLLRQLQPSLVKDASLKVYLWKRSDVLWKAKRLDENAIVLELLVNIDPKDAKAQGMFGLALQRRYGKGDKRALEHFEAAWRLNHHEKDLANWGECLMQAGQGQVFLKELEFLRSRDQTGPINDYVLAIEARTLERLGCEAEASQVRQTEIKARTTHASIYADEARYQQKQGTLDKALAVLNQADENGVGDDHTTAIHAGILEKLGRDGEASALRMKRIDEGSRNAVFYADEARYQDRLGLPEKGLEILEAADKNGAGDDHTAAIRAGLLAKTGREGEASALRMKRINEGSRHAAFYNDEALYLMEKGELSQASTILDLARTNRAWDAHSESCSKKLRRRFGERLF